MNIATKSNNTLYLRRRGVYSTNHITTIEEMKDILYLSYNPSSRDYGYKDTTAIVIIHNSTGELFFILEGNHIESLCNLIIKIERNISKESPIFKAVIVESIINYYAENYSLKATATIK